MKHTLAPLPFSLSSLEPWMSQETLEYHYGKHHQGYVDTLNKLIIGSKFENSSLEEIIQTATGAIFNNGAQVWNHAFFWNCLTPKKKKPPHKILKAIQKDFGSMDVFQQNFKEAATHCFGSGWVWLVMSHHDGKLSIITTSNADNPLREGITPILTCDVWEHAYYIDYRNQRAQFVESFFNLIHWDFVAMNFSSAALAAA